MHPRIQSIAIALPVLLAAACARSDERVATTEARRESGRVVTVADTTIEATLDAAGVAEPVAQAVLSTKLTGTVMAVLVRVGDAVVAGQPLVRIDARDLEARQSQVAAGMGEAEAVHRDAQAQAARMRALYVDSAATRVQLDAAETGLARAEAAVRQAHAGAAELRAMSDYGVVRAPFAGHVTRRFVDPGAFAAPGAPLLLVQDGRRLRVVVTVAPDAVRALRRGVALAATVEGAPARGTVEGIVPAPAGNAYIVNAIVDNAGMRFLPGSAATLALPQGERRAIVVPAAAVRREGDLTGVIVRGDAADVLRWVSLGAARGAVVEVLAGLRAGDRVVVPLEPAQVAANGRS